MRNQPGGQFGGGSNIRSAIPRRNLGLGDLTTIELLNNPVLLHI